MSAGQFGDDLTSLEQPAPVSAEPRRGPAPVRAEPLLAWALVSWFVLGVLVARALGVLELDPPRQRRVVPALQAVRTDQPLWVFLGNSLFVHGLDDAQELVAPAEALSGHTVTVLRLVEPALTFERLEPYLPRIGQLPAEVMLIQTDLFFPLGSEGAWRSSDPEERAIEGWNTLSVDGPSARIGRGFLSRLRAVRVCLVEMPIGPVVTAATREARARRDAAVAALMAETGAGLVRFDAASDPSLGLSGPVLPSAWFLDGSHLNAAGRRRARDWLWPSPAGRGAVAGCLAERG